MSTPLLPGFGPNSLIGDIAGPYVLISAPSRYIDTVYPDIVVEERHTDRLEVTQHPIQTGAVITDHSFAPPAMLTMRCGFSDCTARYTGYVIQIYDSFLALQATRQPFSVSTGKRLYDNMLITSMEVTTDQYNETSLSIVINLQQVTLAAAGTGADANSFSNSAFPQQTGPTLNMGQVSPIPYSGPLPFGR
jgi:hypothetical protein